MPRVRRLTCGQLGFDSSPLTSEPSQARQSLQPSGRPGSLVRWSQLCRHCRQGCRELGQRLCCRRASPEKGRSSSHAAALQATALMCAAGRTHTAAVHSALTKAALGLGDVLHHAVAHLDDRARMHLRSTCRSLRHRADILDHVTSAKTSTLSPEAVDAAFLAQLRKPNTVHLLYAEQPLTLFHLQTLTGLQHLNIAQSSELDLTPLAGLPLLHELELGGAQPAQNLAAMHQLTSLAISAVGPSVGRTCCS